jgi:Tfp pilus assembly protein PilN
MNIEINLLPEELRPRPPVETRTMIITVVIVALVAAVAYFYIARSGTDSDRAGMEDEIAEMQQQTAALQAAAKPLTDAISSLKTTNQSYDTFVAARIDWGDALSRVQELVPQGIGLTKLTQNGNTLTVEGTTSGYNFVASYARSLDLDKRFVLAGIPALNGNEFSMILAVRPGGGS